MYNTRNNAPQIIYKSDTEDKGRLRLVLTFILVWAYIILLAGLFTVVVYGSLTNLNVTHALINFGLMHSFSELHN